MPNATDSIKELVRIHGGDDSVVEVLEAGLLSQGEPGVLLASLHMYLTMHASFATLVETAKAAQLAKREVQRAQRN